MARDRLQMISSGRLFHPHSSAKVQSPIVDSLIASMIRSADDAQIMPAFRAHDQTNDKFADNLM